MSIGKVRNSSQSQRLMSGGALFKQCRGGIRLGFQRLALQSLYSASQGCRLSASTPRVSTLEAGFRGRCAGRAGRWDVACRGGLHHPGAKREPADKPGSVEGNHSSGTRVAADLKRPTRRRAQTGAAPSHSRTVLGAASLFGLAPGGVCRAVLVTKAAVRSYRTVSPLPARDGLRRFAFCCTFRGLTPPRRYLAPGLPEPGLSSTAYAARTQQRLPGRLPGVTLHAFACRGFCACGVIYRVPPVPERKPHRARRH